MRLTVLVGSAVPAGSLGLGVVASSGRQLVTGNLTLRIEPASITDAGPPPATSSPAGVVISGIGTPVGVLRPGARLPVSLLLVNPHSGPVVIGRLSIRVQSTSKSGCRPSDFSISQFSGHYPIRLAAGQSRTLAKLGVPAADWPRLIMLNLPANRMACAGARCTCECSAPAPSAERTGRFSGPAGQRRGSAGRTGSAGRQRDADHQPAAGRVVQADGAVHRLDETAGDGQPSPTPAPVLTARSSRRWNGSNTACPAGRRDARPAVDAPAARRLLGLPVGQHPDRQPRAGCSAARSRPRWRSPAPAARRRPAPPAGPVTRPGRPLARRR